MLWSVCMVQKNVLYYQALTGMREKKERKSQVPNYVIGLF